MITCSSAVLLESCSTKQRVPTTLLTAPPPHINTSFLQCTFILLIHHRRLQDFEQNRLVPSASSHMLDDAPDIGPLYVLVYVDEVYRENSWSTSRSYGKESSCFNGHCHGPLLALQHTSLFLALVASRHLLLTASCYRKDPDDMLSGIIRHNDVSLPRAVSSNKPNLR